ncbi:hypothetical protein SAMN04487965_0394 [Microbulbifer donghaiensis]|uniref:Uncharacterized protein n=1 Tax=Microbulbifer donghaiensis TaxID=494016 RepID=A0A1M4VDI4_9GAMM|nr:DUF6448 family protein [Microbulbifer donghaiensis]SHE66900.1 hypothetical protein SAMN04487965_0394 [Microbulbifer donghaiensis]
MISHRPAYLVPTVFFSLLITLVLLPSPATAHCDALDGPVVTLAKKALDTGNVNLVLPWVPKNDEPEIRRAFDHTLSVRKLGPRAMSLADTFFFETLVRVHRGSEGAPYTGLKAAGRDLGPAIPAADKALDSGSKEAVEELLTDTIRKGLHEHFHTAMTHKDFDPDDVVAGRRHVQAYVAYVHYVEGLWEAATKSSAKGPHPQSAPHPH